GLDEGFGYGNYEDEDFCARLQMLGLRIGVLPSTFVFHHGSVTFRENRIDHLEWMIRNLDRYVGKLERFCTQPPRDAVRRTVRADTAVSVIVRTHNRPDDLKIALNSLAWQSFDDFEVIVVNDGGCDVSEVLSSYEEHLRLEHVINESPRGPSAAANDGLAAARGKYVAFLDDDDIAYPFHLASLVSCADRSQAPVVYSHYNRALVRGHGDEALVLERAHMPPWRYDRSELLVQNRPAVHTWLVARHVFDRHGLFDADLTILWDWDFLLRVTEKSPLVGLPRETCEYRIYLDLANSVTSSRRRALDELQRIYARHPASSGVVRLARKLEVAGLESQVHLAARLLALADRGDITREDAARRYIAEVFGIRSIA
ncbi:MAG TPA: glycosyltransferase, partial [Dehalococcoidia bacterium]|nr:glycosyltransferase [Dehalococcoidia bacterium]